MTGQTRRLIELRSVTAYSDMDICSIGAAATGIRLLMAGPSLMGFGFLLQAGLSQGISLPISAHCFLLLALQAIRFQTREITGAIITLQIMAAT